MPAEDESGRGEGVDDCSLVDVTAMDGDIAQNVGHSPPTYYEENRGASTPILLREASGHASHLNDGMPAVREQLRE